MNQIYYDAAGNECDLYQLVNLKPQWACNRIHEGEKAIEKNRDLLKEITKLNNALETVFEDDFAGYESLMAELEPQPGKP